MKKWFLGIAFFVVLYVFFVVARTPAQWVIQQADLPKNVIVQGVEGTIWNSKIAKVIVDGYVINAVNSQVSVLSLLTLNPSVDVTFGGALVSGPEGKATLTNLLGNINVSNATVSVLANDVAQQLVLPIPLTAKKYLDVSIEEFEVGGAVCSKLTGDIRWENGGIVALDQHVKLGHLKADLSCNKGQGLIKFDPKNNLGLSLSVNVHSLDRVSGNGFIKPGSKFPKALNEVLPFLGRPDSQGRYKLNF